MMRDMFVALGRSTKSLVRSGVFWHLIWPAIVSALCWTVVALFFGAKAVDALMEAIRGFGWVGGWISASAFAESAVLFMVKLLIVLAFAPLVYVTSTVLVSTVALPIVLDRVARYDYTDLEHRRGGSNMGSIGNTLAALVRFVLILAVSLPLWLIPGVALVVPVLAMGWLNQRIYGYDALMLHADRDEFTRLRQELRPKMLLLGSGTTLLAYVPVVNFVAAPFSGLAFVHFMLEALRGDRRKRGAGT
jgi:uncharacterized protein involved in cysteine biosynthesis